MAMIATGKVGFTSPIRSDAERVLQNCLGSVRETGVDCIIGGARVLRFSDESAGIFAPPRYKARAIIYLKDWRQAEIGQRAIAPNASPDIESWTRTASYMDDDGDEREFDVLYQQVDGKTFTVEVCLLDVTRRVWRRIE